MITHYQNLRVAENAETEVIKAAYKALAQKWHPDRNPADKEKAARYFKIIVSAYAVLSNPVTRKEYDDYLLDLRLHQATSESQYTKKPSEQNRKNSEHLMLTGKTLRFAALKYTAASLVFFLLVSVGVFRLALLGKEWAVIAVIMFIAALMGNTLMILAGSYGPTMKQYKLLLLMLLPWLVVLVAGVVIVLLPYVRYLFGELNEAFSKAPFATVFTIFAIGTLFYLVESFIKKKLAN